MENELCNLSIEMALNGDDLNRLELVTEIHGQHEELILG